MKRSKTDLCLLCKSNPSDKRNSHIIPKFINKSILREGDGKAQMVSSKSGPSKKVHQDSPKEDYILCSTCEADLSKLETAYANKAHKSTYDGTFKVFQEITAVDDELRSFKFVGDSGFGFTFWLSIFWRISISSDPLFKKHKLDANLEKDARVILYDALRSPTFQSRKSEISFVVYPTTKTSNDSGNLIISAFRPPTVYAITSNTYAVIMHEKYSEELERLFRHEVRTEYNQLVVIERPQKSLKDFNQETRRQIETRMTERGASSVKIELMKGGGEVGRFNFRLRVHT